MSGLLTLLTAKDYCHKLIGRARMGVEQLKQFNYYNLRPGSHWSSRKFFSEHSLRRKRVYCPFAVYFPNIGILLTLRAYSLSDLSIESGTAIPLSSYSMAF